MGYGLTHPGGGPDLGLRLDPARARAAAGFDYFAIGVPDRAAMIELAARCSTRSARLTRACTRPASAGSCPRCPTRTGTRSASTRWEHHTDPQRRRDHHHPRSPRNRRTARTGRARRPGRRGQRQRPHERHHDRPRPPTVTWPGSADPAGTAEPAPLNWPPRTGQRRVRGDAGPGCGQNRSRSAGGQHVGEPGQFGRKAPGGRRSPRRARPA